MDRIVQFDHAVRLSWEARDLQTQRQIDSGTVDAGTRGSVTGGKHLGGVEGFIAGLFRDSGVGGLYIQYGVPVVLPGHYRRTKAWDIVVTQGTRLVAAIEVKSQSGSFGNNFNNRTEEAIGNAVDLRRATREGVFGEVTPWLGFVMVVEEHPKSLAVLSNSPAIYPTDPIFDDTSYLDRYRILFKRLIQDRVYDAATVIASPRGGGISPGGDPELSPEGFIAAIEARLTYIAGLPPSSGSTALH